MENICAFPIAGGIQINTLVDANTINCRMVFPEDADWEYAGELVVQSGTDDETEYQSVQVAE